VLPIYTGFRTRPSRVVVVSDQEVMHAFHRLVERKVAPPLKFHKSVVDERPHGGERQLLLLDGGCSQTLTGDHRFHLCQRHQIVESTGQQLIAQSVFGGEVGLVFGPARVTGVVHRSRISRWTVTRFTSW
jgi:hypothetical protein